MYPDLDHDVCMTLLAQAGMYLVLDVNLPQQFRHLNRYEPWSTYNTEYLENVFKVVEQFGGYNNTLGFFAGNEIVNDRVSARNSPRYVKAVVRDIKQYIDANLDRKIPVGYSAADDLDYRISMSLYLECVDESPFDSADFYGVNSYQWCGEQTFYSSRYDKLVEDYAEYTRPVFLSEYGCNDITPRKFSEVQAIYSNDMVGVFSGGLVYEFTQEPNNYGLVEVLPNGDVQLLDDFIALKYQFEHLPEPTYGVMTRYLLANEMQLRNSKKQQQQLAQPLCKGEFTNLAIEEGMPLNPAVELLGGIAAQRGKYVKLDESQLRSSKKVYGPSGKMYLAAPTVQIVEDTTLAPDSGRRRIPLTPNHGMLHLGLIRQRIALLLRKGFHRVHY